MSSGSKMAAGGKKEGTIWLCSFNNPTKTIEELQSQKGACDLKHSKM